MVKNYATMIMNMSSEIGHMFVDKDYLTPGVTQDDIMHFFTKLIGEYHEMKKTVDKLPHGTEEEQLVAKLAIYAGSAVAGIFGLKKPITINKIEVALELALEKLRSALAIIMFSKRANSNEKF